MKKDIKKVIPYILLKDGAAFLADGSQIENAAVYCQACANSGADELLFVDTSTNEEAHHINVEFLNKLAKNDLGVFTAGGSCGHIQKSPSVIADTVAQSAKDTGGGVIPGDGAHAGNALLQMDAQPGTLRGLPGSQGNGMGLSVPADTQGHRILGCDGAADILCAGDGFFADGKNFIAGLQA